VQKAGIEALRNSKEACEKMRQTYQERRDYLIPELRRLGFSISREPQGAFYLLLNARRFSPDSLKLARRLLLEAGVAVTPGIDFGSQAEGYIRISYATTISELRRAIKRIENWLKSLRIN
jgi:aspartate aminotransferase